MSDEAHHSSFSGPVVKVAVGPDAKLFYVHKNILCRESDYFVAACTERWLAEDGIVKLPDDDPRIFQELLNYLYVDSSIFDNLWEVKEGDTGPHIHLYILADKLQFKNLLSELEAWCCGSLYGNSGDDDYIISEGEDEDDNDGDDDGGDSEGGYADDRVTVGDVNILYENTLSSSKLRKIIAHSIARELADSRMKLDEISELLLSIPEFGSDLVAELTEGLLLANKERPVTLKW